MLDKPVLVSDHLVEDGASSTIYGLAVTDEDVRDDQKELKAIYQFGRGLNPQDKPPPKQGHALLHQQHLLNL